MNELSCVRCDHGIATPCILIDCTTHFSPHCFSAALTLWNHTGLDRRQIKAFIIIVIIWKIGVWYPIQKKSFCQLNNHFFFYLRLRRRRRNANNNMWSRLWLNIRKHFWLFTSLLMRKYFDDQLFFPNSLQTVCTLFESTHACKKKKINKTKQNKTTTITTTATTQILECMLYLEKSTNLQHLIHMVTTAF